MEEVGEAREAGVGVVALAFARVLGQMQRQRPLRPEQAEEAHAEARRRMLLRPNDISAAGAKSSSGSWPRRTGSSAGLSARPRRASFGKAVSMRRKVWKKSCECGARGRLVEQRRQRRRLHRPCGNARACCMPTPVSPQRGGQRMISPRCEVLRIDSVKVFSAA